MLRHANENDLPQVNALRLMVADMHREARPDIFKARDISIRMANMESSALEMLADENQDIVVCEQEGIIAGFACVEYVINPKKDWAPEQRFCYVKEFGVDVRFRRQGIGKALMAYVQQEAAQRGFHRMELDVWEFNESALKLYESLGFRPRYRYMELDFD